MDSISLLLWPNKGLIKISLEKEIDCVLSGYKYYPEYEWAKYGVRPPENNTIIGSWRDGEASVFIFLFQNNLLKNNEHYIINLTGKTDEIEKVEKHINNIKHSLISSERKILKSQKVEKTLEKEHTTKTTNKLIKFVCIFTVIINAFSAYLKKTPSPTINIEILSKIYTFTIILIHLLALFLLILVCIISILYLIKYAFLLIKRH